MRSAPLEKDIERYLVKRVKEAGGKAYKFVSPGHRGVPDRLCVFRHGYSMFVEVKAEGGKLSSLQMVEITYLRDLGHKVAVVWNKEAVDLMIGIVEEDLHGLDERAASH